MVPLDAAPPRARRVVPSCTVADSSCCSASWSPSSSPAGVAFAHPGYRSTEAGITRGDEIGDRRAPRGHIWPESGWSDRLAVTRTGQSPVYGTRPTRPTPPPPTARPSAIRIDGDRLTLERVTLVDAHLAAFVAERAGGRPPRAARARAAHRAHGTPGRRCRPWTWMSSAASSRGSLRQAEASSERAARGPRRRACARTSPTATAGCHAPWRSSWATAASCARSSADLFDETKRDSAMGRMRTMLGTLLRWRRLPAGPAAGPHPPGLPAPPVPDRGQRRLRAAQRAADGHRGGRRRARRRAAKSSAKGADFEDLVGTLLGEVARGTGDLSTAPATRRAMSSAPRRATSC